jgi:Cu(I)/Ag(I) efflux system membrane protein CusA/SilA
VQLAQNMPMPGGGGGLEPAVVPSPIPGMVGPMSDAPGAMSPPPSMGGTAGAPMSSGRAGPSGASASDGATRLRWIPLGELADVRIAHGPPMVRDEDGLLVGYVYVDVDTGERDIGGYVAEAKRAVERAREDGRLRLAPGMFLKWTGQYELLEKMTERMKIALPLTAVVILLLLYLHFRNAVEVAIVACSIPFALIGSVWAMYLLDYRVSTAVWVGVIALAGLAAQTGIVMIVYIDQAFERRKRAGKMRTLQDIVWAHMEGTVLRVRPKLMTVATMMAGLLPLLWAEGTGADVMKRIAAPMVGGLITSAFLTLEVIPVIYTYWRWEQLLWERVRDRAPARMGALRWAAGTTATGALLSVLGVPLALVYLPVPMTAALVAWSVSLAILLAGAITYLALRFPTARAVAHA